MKKHYLSLLSVLFVCACATILAPPVSASTGEHVEIRVFASDAVEQPLRQIGHVFEQEHPNVKLHYEFSASGIFYVGIVQGVPPDIYVSAGNKYQNKLAGQSSINLPSTVGYDYLAVATPCNNGTSDAPMDRVTESNLIQRMMDKDIGLTMADPGLSPAGVYTMRMLAAINSRHPGAEQAILSHAHQVLSPAQILPRLEHHQTQMGIVYASQIVGQRKAGACLNAVAIPRPYNSRVEFTISVLNQSKFHFVSPERKALDRDFRNLVLSRKGQEILKAWGFVPA